MRILYIITQGEQGGGQKNVFDLAVGMKNKGHDVYVAVGDIEHDGDKWLHQELEKNGIPKANLFELKNLQREINFVKAILAFFEITRLEKKILPDIVHLHSVMAGTVGAVSSKFYFRTVVYTVHGYTFLEPLNIFKKFFYIVSEFIASFFRDFTIMITNIDIKEGKKFCILRNNKNYKLIYNGVNEDIKKQMLEREGARKYLIEKIPPTPYGKINSPIVGTISNLFKTKGLEYLIDAAEKVVASKPNTVFVVLGFGDESYKKELEERITAKKLDNNFFLLGKTQDAYKYLKGLDLFTLTSVKEGLPYSLLEAKMAGVPILASAVGGIPEMAKNFPIELVEAKNIEQISEEILKILKHPQPLLKQEGGSATDDKLPEIYSLENMITQTEGVYKLK